MDDHREANGAEETVCRRAQPGTQRDLCHRHAFERSDGVLRAGNISTRGCGAGETRGPAIKCEVSDGLLCAMSNVDGAITKPPNGNLFNGSFGNLVVERSTFDIAQQTIYEL